MKSNDPIKSQAGFGELPSVGQILEGRYEIVRLIGKGGMGVVVEAHDLRLKRAVAIKLMHAELASDPTFSQRFEREVLIAKDLSHPNNVRIYDVGQISAGAIYLVMEFLQGRELKALIKEGPMRIDRVVDLGIQLLDGLAEAHMMNVVHRDLKPSNIFVTAGRREREVIKILDFGIAKSLGSAQQNLTKTGNIVGTFRYIAPELCVEGNCTQAADVYSIGLILLEMLFGGPMVDANTLAEMIMRQMRMPLVLPATLLRHPLGPILTQSVEKDPRLRYPNAEAMLEALQAIDLKSCHGDAVPKAELAQATKAMLTLYEASFASPGEAAAALDENPTMMDLIDTGQTLVTPVGQHHWAMAAATPDAQVDTHVSHPTPVPARARISRLLIGAILALFVVIVGAATILLKSAGQPDTIEPSAPVQSAAPVEAPTPEVEPAAIVEPVDEIALEPLPEALPEPVEEVVVDRRAQPKRTLEIMRPTPREPQKAPQEPSASKALPNPSKQATSKKPADSFENILEQYLGE
ncbi:MAG: protein kinase [Bradymonadaceae bacterium]|nr:protein kinase [Lujinxingiaceae bacterium]